MLTVAMFVIIAALAVGFLFKRLFAKEVLPVVQESPRIVPMLSSPVEAGTRIEASHLGTAPWKGDLTPDTLLDRNSVIGRIAKEDIVAARPLSASLFYPVGQRPPLDLAPGTRAVSVSLGNSTAMVDGLIGQGSFVDVWITIETDLPYGSQSRPDSLSLKLFDGVKIIAINGSLKGRGRDSNSVVTMELDAEQQSIMVAAHQKGNITLTANPEGPGSGGLNLQMSESDRITLRQILGIEEPDPQKPFVTEQVRGNNRTYSQFDDDGNRVLGANQGGATPNAYGSAVNLQRGGASAD
jgi:pilus assembly protein CpaB